MKYQKSFRNLIVWKEAKNLTLKIYQLTKTFPQYELYTMANQLRKSASSVMANIAEGNDRRTDKDKLHFFWTARASLSETDCFLELAAELNYLQQAEYAKALEQVNKTSYLLSKLIYSYDK